MRKLYSCIGRLAACLLLAASSGQLVAEENTNLIQSLSFSSYYSAGDYSDVMDTEIFYFPLSYGLNFGKLGLQFTIPHLEVTGPGNVLVNVGGINRAVAGTQRQTATGVGDSILSLTYQLDSFAASAPFIDLRLDIKLPSADEKKGLGTGEVDYSGQIDFSQYLGNSVLFATFGYTFRGNSSIYQGLSDSAFAQLGFATPVSSNWNFGIFYDFRQSASSFTPEVHELVPYFSWEIAPNWTFTGMTSWGFTEASADLTALGQISYRW